MPASRPQHPTDKQAKTNSTLTPKHQNQQNIPQQQAIVSSPFNSPATLHVDRFEALPAQPSDRSRVPPLTSPSLSAQRNDNKNSSKSNVTDIAKTNSQNTNNNNSDSKDTAVHAPSSSPLSSTSSFSGGNVGPSYTAQQQQQQQRQSPSQMSALAEARLFAQQLHQQQLQLQQQYQQHGNNSAQSGLQLNNHINSNHHAYTNSNSGDSRRSSMTGARSTVGSVMSGRMSTLGGAGSAGGSSPVLGGGGIHFNGVDEPAEQTLLLARPYWVPDQEAAACRICAKGFSAVRRKHHCRQCGHVFCYDCCSRSITLPQLGYTKAVRVCNDCFEVAYLVAYCLSDDLGPSTQIHGARGIYELIEANDEKALNNVLSHGGLDAMIYLCSMVHGYELHSLATSALAALAEYQPIQNIIVTKKAMPKLFYLIGAYAQHIINSPPRPPSPPVTLIRMASTSSLHTKNIRRIETVAVVLMNITHIIFQMVPDKLLARQMVMEGAIDGLMLLCVYFPAGVRTRAMENAIRSLSAEARPVDIIGDNTKSNVVEDDPSASSGRFQDEDEEKRQEEATQVSMDDRFHTRLESMQGLAAKCMSAMASDVSNQAFIVDDPERIDRLVQLLYSNNPDVVKYASKTMAYLSLRNDRFKPDIVKGAGAAALLTVIRSAIPNGNIPIIGGNALSEAVSHACCALANLATNTESQEILMSHLDLLYTACSVVGLFPHQREIERHVARLIANLALYDQNKLSLLTEYSSTADNNNGLSEHPSSPRVHPHRYSSPPPGPRRAKGNVIPTLLLIGALTLERSQHGDGQDSDSQQGHQDAIDFMNDDGELLKLKKGDQGYLTPKSSVSEEDATLEHHTLHDDDAEVVKSDADDILKWVTIAGTEDVQRHIIRAIDNLMTSVMDDPSSNQSFKVFMRIKPTIGLIKTFQLVNQDEDTQRRATHVLSTLIEQQLIHAETIAAMNEENNSKQSEQQQVEKNIPATVKSNENDKKIEQERLALENTEQERIEQEKIEQERLEEERLERERVAIAAAAEKERIEQLREEEEKEAEKMLLEQECLEKERIEQEKDEQKRLKKERREAERAEKERIEQERIENERLEHERLEQERLEQERLEQERLEHERLEQERIEQERVEQERLEQERLEQERLKQERLEQERLEQERLEQERAKAEERMEKEDVENERLKNERAEKERLVRELVERARLEKKRLEQGQQEGVTFKAESLEKSNPLPKSPSNIEDIVAATSQDEETRTSEKAKKKKKRKSVK
ncbi:hypothetical protein FBU30_004365 [Linnemannia zychae]|nr:hypothetical protein FBU30_004365 [Linnemannia zychae]